MLVGDLIYNDDFDVNCNYSIYDCTEGKAHNDGAEIIFSTKTDGFIKPRPKILDMEISYITIEDSTIVIEAKTKRN